MSPRDWEKALTDAYWDLRWRQIMEALCETFQAWKAGDLGHDDVSEAIDKAYREMPHQQPFGLPTRPGCCRDPVVGPRVV